MSAQPKKTPDQAYYSFALRIAGDFGVAIAVPIVVFTLVGHYIDTKIGTRYVCTIIAMVLSALLTAKIIYTKAKQYGKEFQNMK